MFNSKSHKINQKHNFLFQNVVDVIFLKDWNCLNFSFGIRRWISTALRPLAFRIRFSDVICISRAHFNALSCERGQHWTGGNMEVTYPTHQLALLLMREPISIGSHFCTWSVLHFEPCLVRGSLAKFTEFLRKTQFEAKQNLFLYVLSPQRDTFCPTFLPIF